MIDVARVRPARRARGPAATWRRRYFRHARSRCQRFST
jgi:hypothetical protein